MAIAEMELAGAVGTPQPDAVTGGLVCKAGDRNPSGLAASVPVLGFQRLVAAAASPSAAWSASQAEAPEHSRGCPCCAASLSRAGRANSTPDGTCAGAPANPRCHVSSVPTLHALGSRAGGPRSSRHRSRNACATHDFWQVAISVRARSMATPALDTSHHAHLADRQP
jgi:hypothetical protein